MIFLYSVDTQVAHGWVFGGRERVPYDILESRHRDGAHAADELLTLSAHYAGSKEFGQCTSASSVALSREVCPS